MNKSFIAGLLLVTLAAFLVGGALTGPTQSEVEAEIGDALVDNCDLDREFREQNRKRSIAAAKSYKFEIQANEKLIEVVNTILAEGDPFPEIEALGKALDRQNRKLVGLRTSFTIVPLPECDDLRAFIED